MFCSWCPGGAFTGCPMVITAEGFLARRPKVMALMILVFVLFAAFTLRPAIWVKAQKPLVFPFGAPPRPP